MVKIAPRLVLAAASFLLLAGSFLHALAFRRAVAAVGQSNLQTFYGQTFKALWLADSATLLSLALILAVLVARPLAASRAVVALLATVPAGTASFIYVFLGNFFAAHILVTVAGLLLFSATQLPPRAMHAVE